MKMSHKKRYTCDIFDYILVCNFGTNYARAMKQTWHDFRKPHCAHDQIKCMLISSLKLTKKNLITGKSSFFEVAPVLYRLMSNSYYTDLYEASIVCIFVYVC